MVEALTKGPEMLALLRYGDALQGVAAAKVWMNRARTDSNRYLWRRMTARRAQALAWTWRDFAARYEGRTWEKRKVAPGQWIVRVLDAADTWRDVFRVECPIPSHDYVTPQVRISMF